MLRNIGLVLLVVGSILGCQSCKASPATQLRSESVSEVDTLRDFGRVLSSTDSAGRLYYGSNCQSTIDETIPFPKVVTFPTSGGMDSLPAIQQVFRDDDNVVITQAPHGLIKVKIGIVWDAVLKTRIPLLPLSPLQQYNPMLAIGAIENTKEMQIAMHKLGARPVLRIAAHALVPPASGWPHLPSSVANLNVDELLDLVASTFKGIVVYGACTPPSLFDIHFVRTADLTERPPTIEKRPD